MNFDHLNEDNLADELSNIGADFANLFRSGLPSQLGDKVENAAVGISGALRFVGDLRADIAAAIAAKDVLGAKTAAEKLKAFIEDTARFIKMSNGVDEFRKNSYIWAKKWMTPEDAAIMGASAGTPEDYI